MICIFVFLTQLGNTQSIRLGLFFVMTVCAVFTEAFPRGPLKKHCHLTKYRSLSPSELKAIKNIKDKFVSLKKMRKAIMAV